MAIERDYIKEINNIPLLSDEELQDLFERFHKGDMEAKNIIVEHNLRLVVACAVRYPNKGLDFSDLIQEGNIGLMEAVDKFDPSLGYKFSTYAVYWILQKIRRALRNQSKTIRIPIDAGIKMDHIEKFEKKHEMMYGRRPTKDEVLKELNINAQKYDLLKIMKDSTVSYDKVLNEDDGDKEYIDILKDDTLESVEDVAINNILKEEISKMFASDLLSEKEKQILKMRLGFLGNRLYSLGEIGKFLNMTRQGVQVAEVRALKKIKNSEFKKIFEGYLDEDDKDYSRK